VWSFSAIATPALSWRTVPSSRVPPPMQAERRVVPRKSVARVGWIGRAIEHFRV
jgi:hypothetical protein